MNKAILRSKFKQSRSELPDFQVSSLSLEIANQLKKLAWPPINTLSTYKQIKKNNEVDPEPFVNWMNKQYPDINVYQEDTSGNFGLQAYDLIIVPCLAADRRGYRLGYGGGHYDKFLLSQTRALKLGLCYGITLVDELPKESHDIPLDLIAYEGGIVFCSQKASKLKLPQ